MAINSIGENLATNGTVNTATTVEDKTTLGKDDFLKLLRKLNIPVLTTWKSIDFLPEDDPLFFGRPGSIAHRGANFVQQNSDWLLAVGARLDLPQVGFNYTAFAGGSLQGRSTK